ncbi:MAG: hypothetical protein FJW37_06360 [Acidobacteria bacterium]|nr:hypothetical protein [Acidobacteriota bacterium]
MKITFTGRQVELAPAQLAKIERSFAKVAKLLDDKGQSEAHVTHISILTLHCESSDGLHHQYP